MEPAFQQSKRRRVESAEAQWLEEVAAVQEQQDKLKAGGAAEPQGGGTHSLLCLMICWSCQLRCGAVTVTRQPRSPFFSTPAGGGGVGGMLKAVIDTVIGNLQLSISNVHIRWVFNALFDGLGLVAHLSGEIHTGTSMLCPCIALP